MDKQISAAPAYSMTLETRKLGRPLCQVYNKGIRNRFLNALLGNKNQLMIIVPSGCIKGMTFTPADDDRGGAAESVRC